VVVAIDAGHGGEDPGAIGVNKVLEKNVVLSIARGVKRHLDAATGFSAVLVRAGDYYVPLRKRPQLAREARSDFFVSIHADAFKSPTVSGASVYALSRKRATSETARWLVENENRSDLIGGVGKVVLDDYDESVAEMLLDLSMDANLIHSIDAGEIVLAALSGVAQLHKGQLEQAGFVVLKSPDVPSILVETGYISNPSEARMLATSKYQQRIARAIADGVQEYMRRNPPPGTLIAAIGDSKTIRHLVKRGDTLSEIALRYDVSAAAIRHVNRLRGSVIKTGEVLIIPRLGQES
ncbi:MAG: N-acetylmuramoyl-L-alanine amidase, partial [Pseudomonadales bacterium]|nr:N-acetylmuramoyl-L-alanine amidase [Pseudomonadales bacterium]